jgi:rhodanese-related sulfurtransferase
MIMTDRIDAASLRRRLMGDGEIAPLDVREEATFAAGHLLLARSVPLARIVPAIDALVPRRATPIVLIDDADGLGDGAAESLAGLGYTDIAILEGGIAAWKAAGYELFSGTNVPSKAFGELVEHRHHTPSISAEELQALKDEGADLVILDSRPFAEYVRMAIPGGIDCPGAELAYRVHDIAPKPDTLVVVNCAGRTRSIIGAQSLINAGIPNKVVALRNGTMGWQLAGFEVERGAARRPPEPSPAGLAKAKAAAARNAAKYGVRTVDRTALKNFRADADRTTYLLDVRNPEEFEAGHMPESVSAPGGQLVQATDRYVGTLGARLVLIDDTGVRAEMTGAWLRQMGWRDVFVLTGGLDGALETGPGRGAVLSAPGSQAGPGARRQQGVAADMQAYLDWELQLVAQLERDGTARFPAFN